MQFSAKICTWLIYFRDEFWKSHKYESCNVEMESDSEESEEEREVDEEEDEGQTTSRDIKYVIGDVTHPQTTSRSNNIVVHCAGGLYICVFNIENPPVKTDFR